MSVSETCHEVLLASHGEVALAWVFADHAGTSCATAGLTKRLKSRYLLNLLARTAESL